MTAATRHDYPYPAPVLWGIAVLAFAGGIMFTVAMILYANMDRTKLAAAGFALFLVSSLLVRSFSDIWLGIGWFGLFGGFALGPNKTRGPVLYLGLALLGFHLLAIPGSILWGIGNWESTTAVVLWMMPSLMLLVARVPNVFPWLVPAWLIHAGLILYSGPTSWSAVGGVLVNNGGGTGLSHNPNLAAGFLTLGIVYLMNTRYKWLVLPLIPALLFTGSRWGIAVTVAVLVVMVVTRTVSAKPLAAAILVCAGGILIAGLSPMGYRVSTWDSFASAVHGTNGDVQARLAMPHIPSILPRGVAEHPGLHNVPVRIAVENGLLAALVWLGVTGWALWPRRGYKRCGDSGVSQGNHHRDVSIRSPWLSGRFNNSWWMLLCLALLSMLDYYTWMGHLGGFWWLLIGMRLMGERYETAALSPDDTPVPAKATGVARPTVP